MLNKLLCRVSKEDKAYYAKLCKDAEPLLIKLQEMLEEDFKKIEVVSDTDFDNPSWALKQAYKMGLKKGLTMIREYGII